MARMKACYRPPARPGPGLDEASAAPMPDAPPVTTTAWAAASTTTAAGRGPGRALAEMLGKAMAEGSLPEGPPQEFFNLVQVSAARLADTRTASGPNVEDPTPASAGAAAATGPHPSAGAAPRPHLSAAALEGLKAGYAQAIASGNMSEAVQAAWDRAVGPGSGAAPQHLQAWAKAAEAALAQGSSALGALGLGLDLSSLQVELSPTQGVTASATATPAGGRPARVTATAAAPCGGTSFTAAHSPVVEATAQMPIQVPSTGMVLFVNCRALLCVSIASRCCNSAAGHLGSLSDCLTCQELFVLESLCPEHRAACGVLPPDVWHLSVERDEEDMSPSSSAHAATAAAGWPPCSPPSSSVTSSSAPRGSADQQPTIPQPAQQSSAKPPGSASAKAVTAKEVAAKAAAATPNKTPAAAKATPNKIPGAVKAALEALSNAGKVRPAPGEIFKCEGSDGEKAVFVAAPPHASMLPSVSEARRAPEPAVVTIVPEVQRVEEVATPPPIKSSRKARLSGMQHYQCNGLYTEDAKQDGMFFLDSGSPGETFKIKLYTDPSGNNCADVYQVQSSSTLQTVTLGGFSKDQVNVQYTERRDADFMVAKTSTYWSQAQDYFLFWDVKHGRWRVGQASDFERVKAGDPMGVAEAPMTCVDLRSPSKGWHEWSQKTSKWVHRRHAGVTSSGGGGPTQRGGGSSPSSASSSSTSRGSGRVVASCGPQGWRIVRPAANTKQRALLSWRPAPAEATLEVRRSSSSGWEAWPPSVSKREDEAVAADRCMEELLQSEGLMKANKGCRSPANKRPSLEVDKAFEKIPVVDPGMDSAVEAAPQQAVPQPAARAVPAAKEEDEVAAADRAMEELLRAEEEEKKKRKVREQQRKEEEAKRKDDEKRRRAEERRDAEKKQQAIEKARLTEKEEKRKRREAEKQRREEEARRFEEEEEKKRIEEREKEKKREEKRQQALEEEKRLLEERRRDERRQQAAEEERKRLDEKKNERRLEEKRLEEERKRLEDQDRERRLEEQREEQRRHAQEQAMRRQEERCADLRRAEEQRRAEQLRSAEEERLREERERERAMEAEREERLRLKEAKEKAEVARCQAQKEARYRESNGHSRADACSLRVEREALEETRELTVPSTPPPLPPPPSLPPPPPPQNQMASVSFAEADRGAGEAQHFSDVASFEAAVAMDSSAPLWGPVVGSAPARIPRSDGAVHPPTVHEVINKYTSNVDGYVCLDVGEWVTVHYWQGADEWEDFGWCYGHVFNDQERKGWLPQRVLQSTKSSASL